MDGKRAIKEILGEIHDEAEQEAYQDAMNVLACLPSAAVLHWIARTYAAAMPYRPTHAELIISAAHFSQREPAWPPPAPEKAPF